MINPFPESALNDEAGRLFMEDYQQYFERAQMLTKVHACQAASCEGEQSTADVEGGPSEKRQKPVDSKAAEKRRQEKKKSIKRL